jgi:hypothetical protein
LLPYHHRHYYCLFLLILLPIFLKPLLATGMWNNNSKPKTLKEFNLFKPISQQQQIDCLLLKTQTSFKSLHTHERQQPQTLDHKTLPHTPPPTHTHSKTSNTKYTKDIDNEEKVTKKHTNKQQSETPPHKKLQNTKNKTPILSPQNTEQRI